MAAARRPARRGRGRYADQSTAVVHAVPLRLRGQTLGALNLFRQEPGSLGEELDMAAAQGLADIATIAILQYQVAVDAQRLSLQLNEALNSRIVIEQAKGGIGQTAGSI